MNRRTFLRGLGGLGAASLLAGCAGDGAESGRELPDWTADHIDSEVYELPPGVKIKVEPPVQPIPEPREAGAVIPRSAWARGGPILSRVQPMNGVERITFHHSGDAEPFLASDTAETAAHLELVRQWHIHASVSRSKPQGAGMCDIAYHYAIDRAGRVWALRDVKYQGEHVWGMNPHNLGVVVLGNFMIQAMTVGQQSRVKALAVALRAQYRVPVSKLAVHREIALAGHSTDCPGTNMYSWFRSERGAGRWGREGRRVSG